MASISQLRLISRTGLAVASAFGAALLASSAGAQEYDRSNAGTVAYQAGPREDVEVTAPRFHPHRSMIGAEIRDVSISRDVRFDDLDLRTAQGARELRSRIRFTASALCSKLDTLYPVAAEDSPPCFRAAVERAMVQADDAIGDARRSARNE